MVTQHQSQCQQHGPLSEPALTVTSINIEGMSAAKQQLLAELCEKQKCVTNQPIHKDTRSFIYADDLCIATQDASFEKTESTLSAALDSIGDYYEKNHLRANPDKTQTCVFHLRNRKANRQLYISWCGKKLEHTPSPIYMGVTLDRTLSYSTHIAKLKAKTEARNNVLRKLANSKWGTHPSTIKTTALALCYSTAEYACPVWERSAHAHKVDPVLNDACRAITGCLQPTNVQGRRWAHYTH